MPFNPFGNIVAPTGPNCSPYLSPVGCTSLFLSLLPRRWFSEAALQPGGVLYNLVLALCTVISDLFGQSAVTKLLMRLPTNTSTDIDSWVTDFFGPNLLRNPGETDAQYVARAMLNIAAKKSVKEGVEAIASAFGAVTVVEPFQVNQMGALGSPYFACGSPQGGVGSMQPNPQVYVHPPNALTTTVSSQARSTIMAARPCGMRTGMFQVNNGNAAPL